MWIESITSRYFKKAADDVFHMFSADICSPLKCLQLLLCVWDGKGGRACARGCMLAEHALAVAAAVKIRPADWNCKKILQEGRGGQLACACSSSQNPAGGSRLAVTTQFFAENRGCQLQRGGRESAHGNSCRKCGRGETHDTASSSCRQIWIWLAPVRALKAGWKRLSQVLKL